METYNINNLTLDQAKEILKRPTCNQCNSFISWDKDARKRLNSEGQNRPVNAEKTAVHNCNRDENKKVITDYEAVKLIAKAKEMTESVKNDGQSTLSSSSSITNGSNPHYENGAIVALAMQVGEMKNIIVKQDETITKLLGAVEEQRKVLTDYLTNNPYAVSMNSLVDTLLKYLPEPAMQFTTADKLVGGVQESE